MTTKVASFLAELRVFTKACIGVILSAVVLMQIDVVQKAVTPVLAAHPKLSAIVGGILGIGALLNNPQVRKVLHLDDDLAAPADAQAKGTGVGQ